MKPEIKVTKNFLHIKTPVELAQQRLEEAKGMLHRIEIEHPDNPDFDIVPKEFLKGLEESANELIEDQEKGVIALIDNIIDRVIDKHFF